jgi:hypothetical protein
MHEFGSTGFAAQTEGERTEKVAEWCREYDENIGNTDDENTIAAYFDHHQDEILFLDEDEV